MRFLLPLLLCLGACAPAPLVGSESSELIFGEIDEGHPAAVALSRSGHAFCTGTLVSPSVVMTAAHCIDQLSGDPKVTVFFGTDIEGGGTRIGVSRTRTHSQWNGSLAGGHDIGLLLMDFPVDPEAAIALSHFDMSERVGAEIERVGFGIYDAATQAQDGKKRWGRTTVTSVPAGGDTFIAGDAELITCSGDSGGPAFMEVDGTTYVAGVHSFGLEGCTTAHNGDTRVELYADDFVQPWIQENDPACGADLLCARIGCIDDPDCEPCGPDGTCATDCVLPDVDCKTQELGDLCRADSQCLTDRCVVWRPEPKTQFCTQECQPSNDDCPTGMSCQNILPIGNICYYDDAPQGVLGSSCEENFDCGASVCEAGTCVYACDLSLGKRCPEGFACSNEGAGFNCHALPSSSGGCATAGHKGSWWLLILLMLWVVRKRLLVVLSLCMALAACGGAQSTSESIPPGLMPARIAPAGPKTGPTLRVRIYAGADYRARLVGWQEELPEVLSRASTIVEGATGVRLELVESVSWKRAGGHLHKTLATLVSRDPGMDVDLVIGLVSALEVADDSYETLIAGSSPGRHLVVRSYNLQKESAALGPAAESLSEAAVDRLMMARRRHKQATLLAQGVAQVFGASTGTSYGLSFSEIDAKVAAIIKPAIAARLDGSDRESAEPPPAQVSLRETDRARLEEVQGLLESGKGDEAWEVIEPLLELYPKLSQLAVVACLAAELRSAGDALARCQTATSTKPKEAAPWVALARLYQKRSLVTLAEQAAAKGGGSKSITAWGQENRLRFGVAVGVTAEREADYLDGLKAALRLVYKSDYKSARVSRETLNEAFPASIAALLIDCEIALRKRQYGTAAAACEAVVERHQANTWARYLLGVIDVRRGKHRRAEELLRKVIEMDPQLKQAYVALARVYKGSKNERLGTLKSAYKARFGREL